MPNPSIGKLHQDMRKRVHRKLEPLPHPNKFKSILDKTIIFIGLIGPIITIPQLIKVWSVKDATGLSLITWSTWLLIDIVWITYGFAHKVMPIVYAHGAYFIIQVGVVAGILMYS